MQNLLIGGGRILWMGAEELDLPVPLRSISATIDAEGQRVIPGLIDGHVHVTGGGGEAGFRTRVPPVPLSRFTSAGVTTVVGLLGTDDVARGPAELLATIYALREQGLNAYGYAGGYHVPPATLTGSVRGDLVFIEALIGVWDHGPELDASEWTFRANASAQVKYGAAVESNHRRDQNHKWKSEG